MKLKIIKGCSVKLRNRRVIVHTLEKKSYGITLKTLTTDTRPGARHTIERNIATTVLTLTEEVALALMLCLQEELGHYTIVEKPKKSRNWILDIIEREEEKQTDSYVLLHQNTVVGIVSVKNNDFNIPVTAALMTYFDMEAEGFTFKIINDNRILVTFDVDFTEILMIKADVF
jgi:hypothetical protein